MSFEFNGNTWRPHPEYEKGFAAGKQSLQKELDDLKGRLLKVVDSYSRGSDTDDMGADIKELLK